MNTSAHRSIPAADAEPSAIAQRSAAQAWQHTAPVALLPHVLRLTVANPGFMTGPGTNSYIVGQASTGFGVIDPGPEDDAHTERLWQACGGDIRWIACTHSHPDHSPGALPLQTFCTQRTGHTPTIWGLASGPHARAHSHFVPDATLQHGHRLLLSNEQGNALHTLLAVHTPGHAANHVCLVVLEDQLLISGDHILNGSTTVVDPPDGNMDDYLQSLDVLAQVCMQHGVQHILPAHGHVMDDALTVIARLKHHRLQREAKIARVLESVPNGSLDDWVGLAYDDVPERAWPVAKRSLLAHVERLQRLQQAQ